jgi:flagellar biosynthesis GTPase FlhF
LACFLAGGHAIHTLKSTTIGLLSSRDQKHRAGLKSKSPAAAKRRPAASGLSQDELLAKIDALDWDQTLAPDAGQAGSGGRSPYPDHSTSTWRVAAIVAGIVCVLAAGYVLLGPSENDRSGTDATQSSMSSADAQVAAGSVARTPDVPAEVGAAAVAAAEERRSALYAHAIEEAEAREQQKAEQQRKAREARAAREVERAKVAAQQERERRQKEEARARAEREAAEARSAKAREPVPVKGPSSPQEVCAGESNIFSRGICEARTCGKPEWRAHPFCVKRMEQQIPGFNPGGA